MFHGYDLYLQQSNARRGYQLYVARDFISKASMSDPEWRIQDQSKGEYIVVTERTIVSDYDKPPIDCGIILSKQSVQAFFDKLWSQGFRPEGWTVESKLSQLIETQFELLDILKLERRQCKL